MSLELRKQYETWSGEGLKDLTVAAVGQMGGNEAGRWLLEHYANGWWGRVNDPRLRTNIAGIAMENPLLVGAGWDKAARALLGLHALGFAGVEYGTVVPLAQDSGERPRLWTIDRRHSVAVNRMKFNSSGADAVQQNLQKALPYPGVLGLNVGRNATTPNERAADDHATVIRKLGLSSNYIVINISSPNTEHLRELQDKNFLTDLLVSAKEAMPVPLPLFIKIDAERSQGELYDLIETGLEWSIDGIVASNTYGGGDLKAAYGARWAGESGGLSGADPRYRALATRTVRFLYEEAGNLLTVIGVGGIGDAETALDKMMAGASGVQLVTAMRPSYLRAAGQINRGLLACMDRDGTASIREYIGAGTRRGALHSSDNW